MDQYGNNAVTGVVVNDAIRPDDKEVEATSSSSYKRHPPSLFTDSKGNLKFVNFVCRFPITVLFLILGLCIFVVVVLSMTVFSRGNPFSNEGSYDLKDIRSLAYDSHRLAVQDVRDLRQVRMEDSSGSAGTEEDRLQDEYRDVTYWVFEAEDKEGEGLFGSAESISEMRETVTLFQKDPEYEKYCWLDYEKINEATGKPECKPPMSPLQMYYASSFNATLANHIIEQLSDPSKVETYNILSLCIEFKAFCNKINASPYFTKEKDAWARALNEDMNTTIEGFDGKSETMVEDFDLVTRLAAHLMQIGTKKGRVDFGFDKNFSLNNTKSYYSRTLLTWGGPYNHSGSEVMKKYGDDTSDLTVDELKEMEEELEKEDQDKLKKYIVDNFLKEMDDIAASNYHNTIDSYYFMGTLILDVLLEIVIRDGSLAVYSLIFVFFWVASMVGSWFLAIIGFFEIVFSLPIAWLIMDGIFQVRYFSFLNALALFIVAAIGADDIFIFMDGYKQSAYQSPEVLESLESRMSWVYRRTGSAMATTSATTCAAFLCTLVTPLAEVQAFGIFTSLVILMDYVLVMSLFCTAVVIYHNKFEKPEARCWCIPTTCCSNGGFCRTSSPTPTEYYHSKAEAGEGGEGGRITRFFRHQVTDFITGPVYHRLVLGIIFGAWVTAAVVQTTKLRPTEQTEQFLDDEHPLQKSFTILGNEFPVANADQGSHVYFSWGIGEVDRTGVNQLLKPDYYGEPTFVSDFVFDETCQTAILRVCDDLATNNEYQPYIKYENGLGSVECFVQEMGAYRALGSLSDCPAVRSGAWKEANNWQVPLEELPTFMPKFINQTSCYSGDNPDNIMTKYANSMGWDGKSMKFAAVAAENEVIDPYSTLPEKVVREQYNGLLNMSTIFDDTIIADQCGTGVLSEMTDLDLKFVFMNTQTIYVRSAIASSFLGVGIAFTVLIIATRVLHLALLATLSIVCVLVSITGSIVMLGWSLGSIEAILISIVAGFSVDYVVHLAHAYERAKHANSVKERIRSAYGEMGISVFNGMVTSVGASIPLFLCQLQFFAKFGTFLCLTIGFSWLFANFAFMSVLAQCRIKLKESGKCRL